MWTGCIGALFAIGAAVVAAATGAVAHTFDVKQLDVTAGSLELGLDNTAHPHLPPDANRSAHDVSLDWGAHRWLKLSAVLKLEKPQDDDFRVAKTVAESLFVLKPIDPKRPHDVGLGWFGAIEASLHPDTTNSLLFGPIVTLAAGRLSFTANPFLERTFGRNRVEGVALSYGWNAKYELREGLAVGLEAYGTVDNMGDPPPWSQQEHRIGPAIFAEIELARDFKITPDIGVFYGLTPATPHVAIKLNVGIPLSRR
jgi:hypothetical protein